MCRPKLRWDFPDNCFFSYEYGGLYDDELFFYFKCADPKVITGCFDMLIMSGVIEKFRQVKNREPYRHTACSEGWKVYPSGIDFGMMNLDSIIAVIIQYFYDNGNYTLNLLPYRKLLNLSLNNLFKK